MGHMNVRFYVAKQMESLAIMVPHLGLSRSFRPNSSSTLVPVDQHIRFMKEVHPGRPIYVVGGVLEWTEDSVFLYQEIKHALTGETAAALRTRVRHIEAKTGKPFAWREKTITAFESLKIVPPEHTAPRSINPSADVTPDAQCLASVPDQLNIPVIGRGCVPPEHCDSFGRMKPEHFIGRVSDSVPNLMSAWREEVAKAAAAKGEKVRSGAAVLEYRLRYRKWPVAGDILEVRTGLGDVKPKVHSLVHWITNPITGVVYCTSEAVAITFDLDKRKAIETDPENMALLEKRVPKGLKI